MQIHKFPHVCTYTYTHILYIYMCVYIHTHTNTQVHKLSTRALATMDDVKPRNLSSMYGSMAKLADWGIDPSQDLMLVLRDKV